MDHFPKITQSSRSFPGAPCLFGSAVYDGGSFSKYPSRCGWDADRFHAGDFSEHDPQDTAAFLQGWLYLGVIDTIFGGRYKTAPNDLRYQIINGRRFLSLRWIDEIVNDWATEVKELSNDGTSSFFQRVECCLQEVCTQCKICDNSDSCPLPWEAIHVIRILGCTIDSIFSWFWDKKPNRDWHLRDFALSRIKDAGWCQRDAHLANTTLSELPLLYSSYIQRARPCSQDHSNCSKVACIANQVTNGTYRTKHVSPGCNCDFFEPDVEVIKNIVRNGRMPVICLTTSGLSKKGKGLQIEVTSEPLENKVLNEFFKKSFWTDSAMTISHVWSDGMGNEKDNALPRCQLLKLHDLGQELVQLEHHRWLQTKGVMDSDSNYRNSDDQIVSEGMSKILSTRHRMAPWRKRAVRLWIDTLCIPHDSACKKLAISHLPAIFGKTPYTIVLDSELQGLDYDCGIEERVLRIALSGWMRRAWTFQEAVISLNKVRVVIGGKLVALGIDELDPVDQMVRIRKKMAWYPENANSMEHSEFYNGSDEKEWVKMLSSGLFSSRDGFSVSKILYASPFIHCYLQKASKLGELGELLLKTEMKAVKYLGLPHLPDEPFSTSAFILREARSFFTNMKRLSWVPILFSSFPPNIREEETASRISAAWNGLHARLETKPGDRFIILFGSCSMCATDQKEILELLQLPTEERFKAWLSNRVALPVGMLFLKGPRMQQPGWRWAPMAIHQQFIRDDSPATIVRSGCSTVLRVVKPGFLLHSLELIQGHRFCFTTTADSPMRFIVRLEDSSDSAVLEKSIFSETVRLGIILQRRVESDQEVAGCLLSLPNEEREGEGTDLDGPKRGDHAGGDSRGKERQGFFRRQVLSPLAKKVVSQAANKIWDGLEFEKDFRAWREFVEDSDEEDDIENGEKEETDTLIGNDAGQAINGVYVCKVDVRREDVLESAVNETALRLNDKQVWFVS